MAKGRGQLSHIERLPREADPVIAWAAAELQDTKRTQTELYPEFKARLEAVKVEHGLEFAVPSFTGFNRYSMKLATMTRRLTETREIAATIADRFDAQSSDELTLIAAEAIKSLVFELLTDAGQSGIDPKGAIQLAGALHKATQAQGVSTARRVAVTKEFETKVDKALDVMSKATGLSDDRAAELRRKVLGLK